MEGSQVNKAELIADVSAKSGMTKKDAEKAVNAVIESIEGALSRGEKVSLVGFGTFELRARSARRGRNPRTGEEIDIPASRVPVFKAGKSFKDAVDK
ncbi:MAG: HU family DNA-binding protein [Bacillota bacterium]